MCGIAGIIDYSGRISGREVVEEMLSIISYRGPDESGIFNFPTGTIGNVRLSIIDIESGQQPLSDPSGRYWIVFNGEIFNYRELRHDLESKGCNFHTNSDTEVLVQLFATSGADCLRLLNGQFAFAIWDTLKEELFLARDRVGIRPLFYNLHNGVFTFGSEIKSLFCQKEINPEFNIKSIAEVYTYWTTITPNTAFKNIMELSPGHYMIFNRKGLFVNKYWELRFDNINNKISIDEAIERFEDLFTNSIRIRLRADVEVAAYLSGGIDSSATVSYIKEIEPGILNTFSVGFEDKEFDESLYQNEAVKFFDTNHKSYLCTAKEIAEAFPKVVWHSEIPLTRTAPTPMYLLSKLVRENGIKVVITGEGSDEILSGYNIFKEMKIRRFWANQPESSIRPQLLKRLYPYLPQMKQANTTMLKLFFGYKLDDLENPFYSHLIRWNNSNHIKKHLKQDLKDNFTSSSYDDLAKLLPERFDKWSSLAKAQWIETTIFMSGYLLSSQGDRMALANSVEGRFPFLDYRLIEFCSTLPDRYKLNGLTEKYLLKRLLHHKIPENILKRPKQAYRAPTVNVFMGKNRPEYVNYMLSREQTEKTGVFDFNTIAPIISKIEKTGAASEVENMLVTAIISTHLLHFQFIENNEAVRSRELSNLKIIKYHK